MPLEAATISKNVVTLDAFFHIVGLIGTWKIEALHSTTSGTFCHTGSPMCSSAIVGALTVDTIVGTEKGGQLSDGTVMPIFQVEAEFMACPFRALP
jgi:hypothetical protein